MIDAWTQTSPRAEPTDEEKKKAERLKQAQAALAAMPKDKNGQQASRLARGSVDQNNKLERFDNYKDVAKPRNSTLPNEGADMAYI
jgi:hypothetical protein